MIILFHFVVVACEKRAEAGSDQTPVSTPWSCQYDSVACSDGEWSKTSDELILTGDTLPIEIWLLPNKGLNIDSIGWPDKDMPIDTNTGTLYRFEYTIRPKIVNSSNDEEENQTTEVAYPCIFKAFRWRSEWTLIDSTMIGSLLEEKCFKQRILGRPISFMAGDCR